MLRGHSTLSHIPGDPPEHPPSSAIEKRPMDPTPLKRPHQSALNTDHGRPTDGAIRTTNPRPLEGRVAIVTGGSGGIGSEITRHLVRLGARVVVSYIGDSEPADRLVSSINSSPETHRTHPRAIAVASDVTDPTQVKSLFDLAESTFGPEIHILAAIAGGGDTKLPALADTAVEVWDRTFDVNAKGTFLCCREAANRLVRGGGGRIITMSSSAVGLSMPGVGAYTASKAAVEAMTKVLAKELAGTGITVNGVAPGAVKTPLLFAAMSEELEKDLVENCPLGRLGEPKDIASVVGFLATDAGEWINAQIIRLNGGHV